MNIISYISTRYFFNFDQHISQAFQTRDRRVTECKGKGKDKVFLLQARLWPRGWVQVQRYSSKTMALEGVSGQQHAPAILYPWEGPSTHCTHWVGLRAGLDRWKISPHWDSIPGPSSPQSVAIQTELPGSQSLNVHLLNYGLIRLCVR